MGAGIYSSWLITRPVTKASKDGRRFQPLLARAKAAQSHRPIRIEFSPARLSKSLGGNGAAVLQIRAEKPPDAPGIRAVHQTAFAPSANVAHLVDRLREAGQTTISLVAIADGQLAGHILFSPVSLAGYHGALRGLGLAPLAVLPDLQRQGIGSRLVMHGLEVAREAGFDFAVALGDPKYYGRFGFRPASQYQLDNEYGAGEAFMAVELRPGALAGAAGLVQYRPEFKETGC